jgi:zinc protease
MALNRHWWCWILGVSLYLSLGIGAFSAPSVLDIKVEAFKLENGLEVVVIPDHRSPVVTHMVWYKVGAADEAQGKTGIAHFLEHLLFKGTPRYPAGEFSRLIRRNGGEDNAFTALDHTGYFQNVAKDRLALVMELEADRMANLVLRDEDIATELAVVQEERSSRIDNEPTSLLAEQVDAALYIAHPYGRPVIGWMSEVAGLTRADAIDFYRRYYTPANALVVVAGDVTAAEVRRLAIRYYGALTSTGNPPTRLRTEEPEPVAARRVLMSDARVGIDMIQRSYLAPSYASASGSQAFALDVLADILGGGTSARLSKALVIDKRIVNDAGAYYLSEERDSGRFVVYAVASPGSDLAKIEAALDEEMARIRTDGVTSTELARAKRRLRAEAIYALDSQSRLARTFGTTLVNGGSIRDVLEWPNGIEAVTAIEVQEAAQAILQLQRSVTGIITPPAKAE